jgi:hypothetical protein
MSRYLFLSLCVFFSVAQAAETTPENEAHDLAYSLGASLGERLRQRLPTCNSGRWSKDCSRPIRATAGAEGRADPADIDRT